MSKIRPEDVFTPRSPQLNPDMYVDRPHLERQISDALAGQKNVILYGESGNGKTWLYNRVFQSNGAYFTVLNLGYAKLHSDLLPVITDKLGEFAVSRETEEKGEIKSGIMPQNIGAQVTKTTTKQLISRSDLLMLFTKIRESAGKRPAVLVLDNFEQIVDDPDIIRQIASIIILLDDPALAIPQVKVMIVGVPGDIRTMIGRSSNAATISNRVTEIDEVERLTVDQAIELMRRGFEKKLGLKFEVEREETYRKLSWITDRIAQHIHEICLSISRCAIRYKNSIVDEEVLLEGTQDWLRDSLSADCAVIEQHMNSRETKTGRKNQTLYALGACDLESFRNRDIEQVVRAKFPDSTKDVTLDIPGMMSKFNSSDNPIIRRIKKEDSYRFVSPKYRMAIRAMLDVSENGRVVNRDRNS